MLETFVEESLIGQASPWNVRMERNKLQQPTN